MGAERLWQHFKIPPVPAHCQCGGCDRGLHWSLHHTGITIKSSLLAWGKMTELRLTELLSKIVQLYVKDCVLTDAPWWLMEAADCYPACVKWLEIVRLGQEDLQAVSMGPGTAVHRQSTSLKWASSPLLNGMRVGLIAVEVLYYCIMNGRITFAICIAVSSQGWTWPQASGVLLVWCVIFPGNCSWAGWLGIRPHQNFSTCHSQWSCLLIV